VAAAKKPVAAIAVGTNWEAAAPVAAVAEGAETETDTKMEMETFTVSTAGRLPT